MESATEHFGNFDDKNNIYMKNNLKKIELYIFLGGRKLFWGHISFLQYYKYKIRLK